MIEVKHLTKRYGSHTAVSDLSFTVEKGQIYGFLGPNGAGKSTTMNIMTGCLAATSGEVVIGGYDIFQDAAQAKRLIGYLPEQPPLYLDRTPKEYLRFVARAKGIPEKNISAELDRVMATRKHRLPIHKILVPAVGITERNSTKFTSPGTVLVNRITDFINAHITEPIHVDDVLNHVGVSRSLANLRFRQSTGTSIRGAIEKQRLDLVKDKLLSSRIAINKISKLCGYANVQRLKYVFKKRFGCSMREWRAQHSKQTNL